MESIKVGGTGSIRLKPTFKDGKSFMLESYRLAGFSVGLG